MEHEQLFKEVSDEYMPFKLKRPIYVCSMSEL